MATVLEHAMREKKITADRLNAFSDAVFAVIVTVMVLELRAPDQPAFSALWPLWPTAISYVVSYLFIATMDKSSPPYVVRRTSGAEIDMNQLRSSIHGVAPTLCDRLGCGNPARFLPGCVLRRAVCVHRHCLQRL